MPEKNASKPAPQARDGAPSSAGRSELLLPPPPAVQWRRSCSLPVAPCCGCSLTRVRSGKRFTEVIKQQLKARPGSWLVARPVQALLVHGAAVWGRADLAVLQLAPHPTAAAAHHSGAPAPAEQNPALEQACVPREACALRQACLEAQNEVQSLRASQSGCRACSSGVAQPQQRMCCCVHARAECAVPGLCHLECNSPVRTVLAGRCADRAGRRGIGGRQGGAPLPLRSLPTSPAELPEQAAERHGHQGPRHSLQDVL